MPRGTTGTSTTSATVAITLDRNRIIPIVRTPVATTRAWLPDITCDQAEPCVSLYLPLHSSIYALRLIPIPPGPDGPNLKKIPVVPPPRSLAKLCPNPIANVTQDQLKVLDPTGARARLFSETNPEAAKVGDILLVRLKSGDPFAGVCLVIRKRNSPIDTSILLRNQLTRVGVEMWYKIYSPNVEGIEVVQRKQGKKVRRAKLYYMRKPKHDLGSVEGVVKQYQRQRAGGPIGGKAAAQGGGQRGSQQGRKN